jgi:hypothetical protein
VDVVVGQTFWKAFGSRAINSCLLSDPVFRNKSLGIVLSLSASSPFSWASYAAAAGAIATAMALRSGSYTSSLTHMLCSKTASFRATATAARFFAFFPPRSHSRNPYRRKSVSGPNGPKIYCALPTSSLRTIVSPALRSAVSDDRAYRDLTILSWCKRPVYAN